MDVGEASSERGDTPVASGFRSGGSEVGFSSVLYPGIVRNNEKALRTLGGVQRIAADIFANRNLELCHDPDNFYHRGTFSQKYNISDDDSLYLVVKVRRKKTHGSSDSRTQKVEADICGLLNNIHEFRGLCDFQTLPIRPKVAEPSDTSGKQNLEDITTLLYPQNIPAAIDWLNSAPPTTSSDVPMFLPPFVFSRYMIPSPYCLARDIEHRDETLKAKTTRKDVLGMSLRPERRALSLTVANDDEHYPTEPSLAAVTVADQRIKNPEVHIQFQLIFEERPLWVRNAIQVKTGLDNSVIKWMIGKYAFYITSGPWGRTWCRFGFDPRREPDALRYQTVMVHFRNFDPIQPRNRLRLSKTNQLLTGRESNYRTSNAKTDMSWSYKTGYMPEFRQVYFCLCDIDLPIAKQYMDDAIETMKKAVPGQMADPVYGFLPPDAMDVLRSAIIEDLHKQHEFIKANQQSREVQGDWRVEELEMESQDSQATGQLQPFKPRVNTNPEQVPSTSAQGDVSDMLDDTEDWNQFMDDGGDDTEGDSILSASAENSSS